MRKVYSWRNDVFGQIRAQQVGEEIEGVRRSDGIVGIDPLIDWAANNPESELYKTLDWDNEVAGRKWRRRQMAKVLYSLQHYEVGGGEVETHRTNYGIGGGDYVTMEALRASADAQQAVFDTAVRSLKGWVDRYRDIIHAAELLDDANALLERLKKAEPPQAAAAE